MGFKPSVEFPYARNDRTTQTTNSVRAIHQIAGVVAAIAFPLTGLYMRLSFPDLHGSNETIRMMFRANHIYILLVAATNIGLGLYAMPRQGGWRRTVQFLGTALIVVATAIFIVAFFVDPRTGKFDRPYSTMAILSLALGVIAHLVTGIGERRVSSHA